MIHLDAGPPQEGIQQAVLDMVMFPDRRPLEAHTLLGLGGPLMARGVEDGAALEVSDVLHELDDRLLQLHLKWASSNDFPYIQSQLSDSNPEEDGA